ncbi:hypothetical protein SADUNF_Sadunf18G0064300 [Salix dunnii]|uniref:Protein ABIL5 n=1 Tax=Salix dunnii TaxID=1413687 RepID=A0A835J3K3_9ROSI|nr:hypothetical protein SADUNF_Sadunf18G0064300 [Salix dunnii]
MQISKSDASQNPESHESQDAIRFEKSLQELRDLRSQLHNAANHCEKTFLNTTQKTMVVESTKEYLCKAVVAVVDHLGCVSANLNSTITSVEKSNEDIVRDSDPQASTKILMAKHESKAAQLPLSFHTCTDQKSTSAKNLWSGISTEKGDPNSVPVRDGLSVLSRISNIPTFHFQQCSSRRGRSSLFRKSAAAHRNDFLSLIRRAKRTP